MMPEKYDVNGFEAWKYEEQTKMKHLVFADYFDKWFKILSSWSYLNYIDGFGGIGAYKEKDSDKIYFGSPILVCEIIEDYCKDKGKKLNVCSVTVIDTDKSNLLNIEKILKYKKINIKVNYINGDFDNEINKMLDTLKKGTTLAPTFFLIDPFGFNIKIKTLERIMKIKRSEILLNFMYSGITRNLSVTNSEQVLNDLFGCDTWKNIIKFNKDERETKIIDLYRSQLKRFAKFVNYFRFSFPHKEGTYYYLFHLTNHILGCEIMKSSFAAHNLGRAEYRGKYQYQTSLFEHDVKTKEIEKILFEKFINKEIRFIDLLEEILDEFVYLRSDYRNTLNGLEKQNKIKIRRIPEKSPTGRLRRGIDDEDIIIFK